MPKANGVQAPNLKYNFEVKFLLDAAKVLDTNHELTPELISTFSLPTTATKIAVVFVDTDKKTLYNAGWSPRIRKVEGKRGFELTYKKRYPIESEETKSIDAALDRANADGFDANADKYEAQVEWGYDRMTLSISRDKKAGDAEIGSVSLPDVAEASSMLVGQAPDKFDNDGGPGSGTDALRRGRVYGPVLTRRYVGTLSGVRMTVEVWPIPLKTGVTKYVVEASFKADSKKDGAKPRAAVTELLDAKHWLVHQESLKTQLVMDNM